MRKRWKKFAGFVLVFVIFAVFFFCSGVTLTLAVQGQLPSSKADRKIKVAEQRRVARHEAGHAVVAAALDGVSEVKSISVYDDVQSNGNWGVTDFVPQNRLDTAGDMLRDISVSFAGRAAEKILNGAPTDGADGDLADANDVAWNMRLTSGLDGSLLVKDRSHATAADTAAVKHDLDLANACAEGIVKANRSTIDGLAALVMRQPLSDDAHTLNAAAIKAYLAKHGPLKMPTPAPMPACRAAPAS